MSTLFFIIKLMVLDLIQINATPATGGHNIHVKFMSFETHLNLTRSYQSMY